MRLRSGCFRHIVFIGKKSRSAKNGGYMEQTTRYKRVLIKLSGEALATGITGGILNYDFVRSICLAIRECSEMGFR